MSAVREQQAPVATTSGSLLRAELHRFRMRRFIQAVLGLAVLGWLVVLVIGLFNYGVPDDADYAAARADIDRLVVEQQGFYQDCVDHLPAGQSPESSCGAPLNASDLRVQDFLRVHPFSFVDSAQNGALAFAAGGAVLCFLVGSTWIGAEWSTRSLVALLFWAPRRMRVMGAKLTVLTAATALFAAAMQVAWLAMAGLLNLVAGSGNAVPAGFWGDLLATEARSVLLAVLAALLGFGLANLVRNTGAALGIGFVYFAIAETAVRILRPTWEPWLLSDNALGLLAPGGSTVYIQDGTAGADGIVRPTEYLIGNLQAGLVLGTVTAVVVGIGVVLFARRDIH
jgi:ABC-type transport system involved in multi-copper enzyme maturation permease subunit